jgi:hypothetical protein
MRKNLLLAVSCILLLLSVSAAQDDKKEKKVLKNADIVMMTQNHFDDETLTKIIEVSDTDFDISGDALIELKNQGVSSAVVRAMLQATQKKKQAAAQASPAGGSTPGAEASAAGASSATSPATSNEGSSPGTSATTANSAPASAGGMVSAPMGGMPMPGGAGMGMRSAGGMGMNPQQMAAMQSQLSAMGMGGMLGSMFGSGYSAEQMPHVYLMLEANKGKQEISPSNAQIGQTRFKGGVSPGGMMLRSLATEGLSFAAMGAGPAGMMAMSAFSMASGFMPGMRPGAPSMTYVWGLPGQRSSRELTNTNPMFELSYGNIPGVDPDAYEPAIVKLFPTKDNYRLVGATQSKMSGKNMMAMGGGGPESGKWVSEERWPTRLDKEERGFYVLHVGQPLEPGEYAVVLRPVKGYKASPSAFGGGAQVFYSVWDFSVPGTPPEETGKKEKK